MIINYEFIIRILVMGVLIMYIVEMLINWIVRQIKWSKRIKLPKEELNIYLQYLKKQAEIDLYNYFFDNVYGVYSEKEEDEIIKDAKLNVRKNVKEITKALKSKPHNIAIAAIRIHIKDEWMSHNLTDKLF